MQVKTRVKAGTSANHNETLVRAKSQVQGLTVKTHVKAGVGSTQHNETLVRATPRQRAGVMGPRPATPGGGPGGWGTASGRLRYRGPLARRDDAGQRAVLVWLRSRAIPQVMGELPQRG
jgi:hypothetical protein